jgi:8-oxo-dGTP diphosphatase
MPASEQGITLDRYMLIPRTLIFLTRGEKFPKGEVLLVKGAPDKRLWANRYNGLGGHIERGEDVLSAARRELLEETGVTSADFHLCGTVTIDTGQNPGIVLFVITGSCPDGELKEDPGVYPEGQPEWVPGADLPALPLVEDLPVLLPRVLAHQPGDPPFAGRYWYDNTGKMKIEFVERL